MFISNLIRQVDLQRLRDNIFYLSKNPLPCRRLNYTVPGHDKCTLYEADDFLETRLVSFGYKVEKEPVQTRIVRCDTSKPKARQCSQPLPGDPWYIAYNLYAQKTGTKFPDKIIVIIAHKDSQSWVDSPGANDNAVGTAGILEIAGLLANISCGCSVRFIFSNEEHLPWSSISAANNARKRGDNIIALFNIDGISGKSAEDRNAGKKKHVTIYTTPEGEHLARLAADVNNKYSIGLEHSICKRDWPNDDDGSFINAGYPASVVMAGSFPCADPNYHSETDIPEYTDIENVKMSVQLSLAVVLTLAG